MERKESRDWGVIARKNVVLRPVGNSGFSLSVLKALVAG
jgi:hypothetical protein